MINISEDLLNEIIQTYTNQNISINELSKLYNIGRDKLTKLLKDNNVMLSMERHKLKLQKQYEQAIPIYLKLNNLNETCKQCNIKTKNNFSKFLKSKGIKVINYQNINTTTENIFETIDTEEKAYWLGFLYADGCIGKRDKYDKNYRVELGLKASDYYHLIKFKNFLNCKNEIKFHKHKLGDSYRISVGSKKLSEDLISKGCVPNKSLILKFPTYDIVPKSMIRHFMRGYFDGDGWIGIRQNKDGTYRHRCNIVGTKDFILGFCNEIGVYPKKIRTKGKVFQYEFNLNDCNTLLKFMYDNCNIYLDRKFKRYKFEDLPS